MNAQQDRSIESGCKCQPDLIEKFLSARISDFELERFEQHLTECEGCRTQLESSVADADDWQEARLSLADDETQSKSFDLDRLVGKNGFENNPQLEMPISRMVFKSLAPTDDPEMLGRLGPYEIVGVIGQGGMGVVLKAFDPSLQRTVALKVLAPHLAASGAARQRFFREARAAATVTHENVIPIHNVDEGTELPYLVMPYMRGESLQQRIARGGPLDTIGVVRVGMQIAAGLAAAHAQGLVHRDIKPANIILEQGVERLVITDFGLARAVDDASLTRTGVISGTPEYMSPEQARGESIDARSDLFSLGTVMYAACTGHSPFRAESSYGVLRRITDTNPRPIREINSAIPAWLEGCIFKLLAKDPNNRFDSAGHVAQLLEQCLAHLQHPTSEELPGEATKLIPPRATPASKSVWWIAAGAAVLSLALLSISLLSGVGPFSGSSDPNMQGLSFGGTEPPITTEANQTGEPNQEPVHQGMVAEQVTELRSEHFLPANTDVWISIPSFDGLQNRFQETAIGDLFSQPAMQPFVDDNRKLLKDWLIENDLIFGLDLFQDNEWISGEIAFSLSVNDLDGVNKMLLVEVTDSTPAAQTQIDAVLKKLVQQGATQTKYQLAGLEVVKTESGKTGRQRTSFLVIQHGWLIVSSDEAALKQILENPGLEKKQVPNHALSRRPSFKTTMDRSFIPGVEADIRWFIDPLGYGRIAEVIYEPNNRKRDQNVRILEDCGFDVFAGVGGTISLATDDHDLLHRLFVSTEFSEDAAKRKQQSNVLGLFDFDNQNVVPLHPPNWIPNSVASCFVANWDKSRAFASVGPVYDAFLEKGDFERMVNDFKIDPGFQLDLQKLIDSFDHRSVIFSQPTDARKSARQQSIIAYKLKGDAKFVIDSLVKNNGFGSKEYELLGYKVVEVIAEEEIDPGLDLAFDDEQSATDNELPFLYTLHERYLIVARDKEVLAEVLQQLKNGKLKSSDDYVQVYAVLGRLTNPKNISFRQFARVDDSLEPIYQSIRAGEYSVEDIVGSELLDMLVLMTIDFDFAMPSLAEFAWHIARSFVMGNKKADEEPVEELRSVSLAINGGKLPKDFKQNIAPHLGTAGWVLETEQDGWRVTGCVLRLEQR